MGDARGDGGPEDVPGSYKTSVGVNVAKRETTSSMSKRVKAIAGVNGGFFNIHTARALQGDPVGVSVVGGKLLSEGFPAAAGWSSPAARRASPS
nr:hypothetical protein GCM10020093_100910 [Planobispora longispora]